MHHYRFELSTDACKIEAKDCIVGVIKLGSIFMKDYAKVINQSKEIHGQQQVRQTLTKSAVQKTRAIEKDEKKSGGRGFFSVIAVFIVIAVLFAAYHQYSRHRALMNPEAGKQEAAVGSTPATATNPQFDFYTVLPNGSTPGANPSTSGSTTPSSATPPTAPVAAATTTPAATPLGANPPAPALTTQSPNPNVAPVKTITTASSGQYYLDAGGFSNSADAQQMLSQLLLLGVQANIKTTQENGAPTYEVLVGPFEDQDAMNIVKQQLSAHQMLTTVIQQ